MVDRSEITATALNSVITRLKRLRDAGVREISVPVVEAPAVMGVPAVPPPAEAPAAPSAPEAYAKPPAPAGRAEAAEGGTTVKPASTVVEVRGSGPVGAPVAFVGGAPDERSSATGTPFAEAGGEGQLLTRMIAAMGLARNRVYMTYAVKRAHPEGGTPTEAEVAASAPALLDELTEARPGVVVAFGAEAATALVGSPDVAGLRGRFHECGALVVMPTYSPELMLMDKSLKGPVWKDLQAVMKRLGIEPPGA